MILIQESSPKKLSGLSSLFISVPYNPAAVDIISSCIPAIWHKKDSVWEVSITYLAYLLDHLTVLDDIQLQLQTAANSGNCTDLSTSEITNFRFKPFDHQIEGINYGLKNKKWLLLDNPGCGKTNQIIGLAETLKHRGEIDHCLVIVGINSLKRNWAKEIKTFSSEQSIIIGEKRLKSGKISKLPMPISDRVKQLKSPIDQFFVIINVESLRSDQIITALQTGPNKFGMIAIDEVHKVLASGKKAAQSANCLKLKADYKVAASGSLLLNDPTNCWGPLAWTENDHSTLTNFRLQYCKFGGFNNSQVIGYKNLDLLKEELSNCSLRRKKEDLLDLPAKTITLELLEMNEEHQKFYDAVKDRVKEEIDKVDLSNSNLLALTTRLRQATADPGILTTQDIPSTKIIRCVELVEDLLANNEKCVIMSTYKEPVYKLEKLLAEYHPLICTGDISDLVVSDNVDKFQNDPDCKILIGTLAKISTGLTLNAASYMIMLDEHWTHAMNDQATNRIFRANNTRPAFITVLACADTIDEHVHEISQDKKDLGDFIIDNIESETFNELSVTSNTTIVDKMREVLLKL